MPISGDLLVTPSDPHPVMAFKGTHTHMSEYTHREACTHT